MAKLWCDLQRLAPSAHLPIWRYGILALQWSALPLRLHLAGETTTVDRCRRRSDAVSLTREAHPEVEDLCDVARWFDDGEAEIQGDRHRTKHRHGKADAEAHRHGIVLEVGDAPRYRAAVHETDQEDLITRSDGHLIFKTVEQQHIAAGEVTILVGADAAPLETADRRETTGKEPLVDRRLGAGHAELPTIHQDLPAAAVWTLNCREELVVEQIEDTKGEFAG